MKKSKYLMIMLSVLLFSQFKVKGQTGNQSATGAALTALGLIAIISDVDKAKEGLEREVTEWVIESNEFKEKGEFELKFIDYDFLNKSELQNASVVGFKLTFKGQEPNVILALLSPGWVNEYGINFTKVIPYLITKSQWEKMMEMYLNLAKDNSTPAFTINNIPVSVNGIFKKSEKSTSEKLENLNNVYVTDFEFYNKVSGTSKFVFRKSNNGDYHAVKNFNEDFKIDFNEGRFNLYVKKTKELIRFRAKYVTLINRILYSKEL